MKQTEFVLWKCHDLLRGVFDKTYAMKLTKEFIFLKLLNDELSKGVGAWTSNIQGSFDLKGVTTNEELIESLTIFIHKNKDFHWLNDCLTDLKRVENRVLFSNVMQLLNETSFTQNAVDVFTICLIQDRESFITPPSLCQLIKQLLASTEYKNVYNPTIGVGLLTYEVGKNHTDVSIYGQEIQHDALNLCRMLLTLAGRIEELSELKEGNVLTDPKHLEDGKLKTFDCVVCHPPFGLRDWGIEQVMEDERFHRGLPPRAHADYAFITQVVESMNKRGKAVMLVPTSVLFREGRESEIRKQLIEENLIESIIAFPGNMLNGTAIPVNLVIFNRQKESNEILFIDATKFTTRQRTLSTLTDQAIKEIVKLYQKRESREEISHVASLEEIEQNRYNLKVDRYVKPIIVQETFDLETLHSEYEALTQKMITIQKNLKKKLL